VGTFAHKPPGSGANFKKLSSTLAARGATNPGALAAWIGRRKYGRKGFAKLSQHSHSHPGMSGILLADGGPYTHTHSHSHPHIDTDHDYSQDTIHPPAGPGTTSGTSIDTSPSELRTPAGHDYYGRTGFAGQSVTVRGGSGGGGSVSWSNGGGSAIELANRRGMIVSTLSDLIMARGENGAAIIRHRHGGDKIGEIRHLDNGQYAAYIGEDGRELSEPRNHQRTAIADLIRAHNASVPTLQRPGREVFSTLPAAQPAVQTGLMEQFGVPAIKLATPANGASDGGRTTGSSADDLSGLSPKGATIYKKLLKRGFPAARARAFASRAQNFGGAK
jgi:hypothetical protein